MKPMNFKSTVFVFCFFIEEFYYEHAISSVLSPFTKESDLCNLRIN